MKYYFQYYSYTTNSSLKVRNKIAAGPSNARTVYLITYSQAVESIVPDRETFSQIS